MGLALAIVAAVSLLASGMALFAFARTRGRASRLRHLRAARGGLARALPAAGLTPGLSDIVERSRAMRIELEAIALYSEQIAGIEEAIEVHDELRGARRRPLWRRLEGASYDYAVARAGDGLRDWLRAHAALEPAERELLQRLGLDAEDIHALLARDLQREDQRPEGFADELARAQAALRRFEVELMSYSPQAYR